MLYPELEAKLEQAKNALKGATSESIVELCKQYLALLEEYRSQIFTLQGTSAIDKRLASASPRGDVKEIRKIVRAAIENITHERNRTKLLLLSFTTVSGYEAVALFNRRKYEGHDDWELRASGVKSRGRSGHDLITIKEAVETAGLLRREEHIAQNAA